MKRKIFISVLFCICMMMTGCSDKQEELEVVEVIENETKTTTLIIETEEKTKINISFLDESYLMKIAQYKGGSLEDRVYTILVTLNKAREKDSSEMYTDYAMSMVQDTVLNELYNIHGITPNEFEEIVPDVITIEAMDIVKWECSGMKYAQRGE